MTPLTESELAEVAVALDRWKYHLVNRGQVGRGANIAPLFAKIAALNEGADK